MVNKNVNNIYLIFKFQLVFVVVFVVVKPNTILERPYTFGDSFPWFGYATLQLGLQHLHEPSNGFFIPCAFNHPAFKARTSQGPYITHPRPACRRPLHQSSLNEVGVHQGCIWQNISVCFKNTTELLRTEQGWDNIQDSKYSRPKYCNISSLN